VADTPRDEDEELRHPAEGKNARQPELIITDLCRLTRLVRRYSVWSWSRRCAASLAAVISAPASDTADQTPLAPQQLRQLGDVGGDAPRLVSGQQVAGGTSPRLPLEIEIAERLPVGVLHDVARRVRFIARPRRREAARGHERIFWLRAVATASTWSDSRRLVRGSSLTQFGDLGARLCLAAIGFQYRWMPNSFSGGEGGAAFKRSL
jgi:hypothetical protein